MLLKDVAKNALRLMFDTGTDTLSGDWANVCSDQRWKDRILGMNSSIIRCLKLIESVNKIPCKKTILSKEQLYTWVLDDNGKWVKDGDIYKPLEEMTTGEYDKYSYKTKQYHDFSAIIEDFKEVDKIIMLSDNCVKNDIEFDMLTEDLILLPITQPNESYMVVYHPTIPTNDIDIETKTSLDFNSINVPDTVSCLIPYYIKSELFEEDEPELSVLAKNQFERQLSLIDFGIKKNQNSVRRVF